MVEILIRFLLPLLHFQTVGVVCRLVQRCEQVLRMHTDGLRAFLSEPERCHGKRFDPRRGLDVLAREDDVVVFFQLGVNVVRVAVAGDKTRVQNLEATV